MKATTRNLPRRILAAVADFAYSLTPAVTFALLNGHAIQQMLDLGHLVTVNTILDERGAGPDFRDGYRSWAGRHIATAYRLDNRRNPIKAWVRHRTTRRWIHVFVYIPGDPAIESGLRSYSRTTHLAATAPVLIAA